MLVRCLSPCQLCNLRPSALGTLISLHPYRVHFEGNNSGCCCCFFFFLLSNHGHAAVQRCGMVRRSAPVSNFLPKDCGRMVAGNFSSHGKNSLGTPGTSDSFHRCTTNTFRPIWKSTATCSRMWTMHVSRPD